MFTINTQWALRKNGVRWNTAPSEVPQMNSSSTDAKLAEVRALLKTIDTSIFTHKAEFERLKTLLADIATENQKVSTQIDDAINTALGGTNLSPNEKRDIQALQTERQSKRLELDDNILYQSSQIRLATATETQEFIKDDDKLSRLANLDGDYIVTDTARDFVGEKALKQAISKAAGKDLKYLNAVYKGVTGVDFPTSPTPADYEKFHNALRIQVAVVREMTGGGNAGLEAILQGKADNFIQAIQAKVTANNGKPLDIKSLKESTTTYNALGAVGTVLTALATAGLVTFGTEKHNVEAGDIMKSLERDANGKFANNPSVLAYIKDAFMGRRLSYTLAGAERIADYNTKIIDFAEKVMNTSHDNPGDTDIGKAYATAKKIQGATAEQIKKSLIQSYIIGEGYKNEGSNWSGSIGLLMLAGAHRDQISVTSEKTGKTEFIKSEQEVTRGKVEKTDYEGVGVRVESQDGGKYKYTIPKVLALPGDAYKIPVTQGDGMIVDGDNYTITKDAAHHLKFVRIGTDSYSVVFEQGGAPAADIQTAAPVLKGQNTEIAKDLRGGVDMSTLSGQIFGIARQKKEFPTFNAALKYISDGDYAQAYTALQNEKKAKTVAQNILKVLKINTTKLGTELDAEYAKLQAVNTYKYGVGEVMNSQNIIGSKLYNKARKDTIAGEMKLLGSEYNQANETEFANRGNHEAKKLSDIYPGQQLSVTVAATPLRGIHTKDKYTGSLQVSDQILITLNEIQKKNLLTDHSKKVTAEFEKFKKFVRDTLLGASNTDITEDKYKEYLKTGTLPPEWTSLGIAAKNGPVMFEARAMVQGNRCMNYTVGIGYPTFTITSGTSTAVQRAEPVVSVEGSTPLNTQSVDTQRLDIGANTLGVANKIHQNNANNTPTASRTVPDAPIEPPPTPPPAVLPPTK